MNSALLAKAERQTSMEECMQNGVNHEQEDRVQHSCDEFSRGQQQGSASAAPSKPAPRTDKAMKILGRRYEPDRANDPVG